MIVYGLSTCDTCRKAIRALRTAGYDPQIVDVRADGVPPDELSKFYAAFGDEVINRRSTTWRGLDEKDRSADAVALLQAHPTLMKRPVIDHDGALHLGWTAAAQAALVGR